MAASNDSHSSNLDSSERLAGVRQGEVISQFSVIEDLYECIFLEAATPRLGNMYVAGTYLRPNTPSTDFTQFNTNTLEYTDSCRTFNKIQSLQRS